MGVVKSKRTNSVQKCEKYLGLTKDETNSLRNFYFAKQSLQDDASKSMRPTLMSSISVRSILRRSREDLRLHMSMLLLLSIKHIPEPRLFLDYELAQESFLEMVSDWLSMNIEKSIQFLMYGDSLEKASSEQISKLLNRLYFLQLIATHLEDTDSSRSCTLNGDSMPESPEYDICVIENKDWLSANDIVFEFLDKNINAKVDFQ